MDLDAYRAAHEQEWARLEQLAARGRLAPTEADELIARYQSAATDLSVLQTAAGSSIDVDRLSIAIARARLKITGSGPGIGTALATFFGSALPAALYRIRWLTLAVALATILIGWLYAAWLLNTPGLFAGLGSEEGLRHYAEVQFTGYYTENASSSFAAQVWTNNAWIAAQCVAFGVTGIWVPYVIVQNAIGIGQGAAIMFHFDRGGEFFLHILPHGMLELTSVFVAGAAGLRIFWAWVAPGNRTRGESLAENGRSLMTVALGLIIVLFISGLVEGFVTGSALPWAVKIAIGALVFGAFLFYMIVIGGRAARAGATGDLDQYEAGARTVRVG